MTNVTPANKTNTHQITFQPSAGTILSFKGEFNITKFEGQYLIKTHYGPLYLTNIAAKLKDLENVVINIVKQKTFYFLEVIPLHINFKGKILIPIDDPKHLSDYTRSILNKLVDTLATPKQADTNIELKSKYVEPKAEDDYIKPKSLVVAIDDVVHKKVMNKTLDAFFSSNHALKAYFIANLPVLSTPAFVVNLAKYITNLKKNGLAELRSATGFKVFDTIVEIYQSSLETEWHLVLAPYMLNKNFQTAKILIKRHDTDKPVDKNGKDARFVVELQTQSLGEVMIDGLFSERAQKKSLYLTLRSADIIPDDIQIELNEMSKNLSRINQISIAMTFKIKDEKYKSPFQAVLEEYCLNKAKGLLV